MILAFFWIQTGTGQESNDQYKSEIKQFFEQILHDSTHYSYQDFVSDSAKSVYPPTTVKKVQRKVDTTDFKYTIATKYWRDKFTRIVIAQKPLIVNVPAAFNFETADSIHKDQLSSFICAMDSTRISMVNQTIKVWSKDIFDVPLISQREIQKLIRSNDEKGWNKFYKKHRAVLLAFTVPVFNATYDIAFLKWNVYCGNRCSVGYSAFYRKVNGKWILIVNRVEWDG
jgi:hypothetical protein